MKKLILSVTMISLLAASLGPVAFAQPRQELPPVGMTQVVHGAVPAQTSPAEAMRPAIHALVLSMTENNLAFDPNDSQFLWTSLYYMLGLYGQQDQRAVLTDDTLILPAEVISDYAAALYPQVGQLPSIPSPIDQRISYHANEDVYHLARGDAGLAEVSVDSSVVLEDGSTLLSGALVYPVDGSTLVSFQATLVPQDTMFGFRISNLLIGKG